VRTKLLISITLAMVACSDKIESSFQAERVQRTGSFVVHAGIEKSFPLFGPIREKDWAYGWEPTVLLSKDFLVEEHMVFQTNGSHGDEKYTWTVSKYQPELHLVEYTVFTSERLWFITVSCEEVGDKTEVKVTYTYTGLTDEGNRKNKEAMAKMFADDLKDWEAAINHYLETGQQLTTH